MTAPGGAQSSLTGLKDEVQSCCQYLIQKQLSVGTFLFCFADSSMLAIIPRALHILGNCSTTELHS